MAQPKIATLQSQRLSHYLSRGSLILCFSIIGIVLLANLLERCLLGLIHKDEWTALQKPEHERRRRSFTYFHVGLICQIGLVIIGAYPTMDFLVGHGDLSKPLMGHLKNSITIGDMLFVACQIHSGYYLFELCFRTHFASPITIAHHIGLLAITQSSIALFGDPKRHPEAVLDFYMCMVWGAFDVVVEIPIYTSMILWRLKSNQPKFLYRMMYACCAWVVTGATVEVALTIYLLNASWHRWPLAWQVVIPMVFSLWIITQLYGAFRIRAMALSQTKRNGAEQNDAESDAEKAQSSTGEGLKIS